VEEAFASLLVYSFIRLFVYSFIRLLLLQQRVTSLLIAFFYLWPHLRQTSPGLVGSFLRFFSVLGRYDYPVRSFPRFSFWLPDLLPLNGTFSSSLVSLLPSSAPIRTFCVYYPE
jgi:hypothetical protein